MPRLHSLISLIALSALSAILTGCGIDQVSSTNPYPASVISGKVRGGQQPISNAQVYLYAANTSTYGGAPTSLLNSPGYVTTDADGNFSFNGAYSLSACQTAHQLVYLVAVGGNPGAGSNNPNAVLMAALGDCANLSASTFIYVNEVTTVASVYALQQFMSPRTYNVGTSSTNLTGLQNAFLTVPNLVDLTTGNALATTPAGNGTVPQTELNSLANILAACINSASPFTSCASLYTAATPAGGAAPTDTFGAILDIALNPGNNVGTLYLLPPPDVAFAPALTPQPNDWTISIIYRNDSISVFPDDLAIDSRGNVWVANAGSYFVSEFNPAGVSLQGTSGLAVPVESYALGFTPTGNLWVSGFQTVEPYTLYLMTTSGTILMEGGLGPYLEKFAVDASGDVYAPGAELTTAGTISYYIKSNVYAADSAGSGIAIDQSGDIWLPEFVSTSNGLVTSVPEITPLGTLAAGEPAAFGWADGIDPSTISQNFLGVAIDAQGAAWVSTESSSGPGNLAKVSATGVALSVNATPTYGGSSLAVDGANTIWTGNSTGSISHFSTAGVAISSPGGYFNAQVSTIVYGAGPGHASRGLGIDASGNVWLTNIDFNKELIEWVGVAAPVTTPVAQNLVNNSIGQRP